jgi:hypothetical protein
MGAGIVNARFGGRAVPYGTRAVAPGLMVAAIILFMGAVSGARLNGTPGPGPAAPPPASGASGSPEAP